MGNPNHVPQSRPFQIQIIHHQDVCTVALLPSLRRGHTKRYQLHYSLFSNLSPITMTAAGEVQEVVLDPPPPYPTPRRSRRARRSHLPTPQPFAINQQPQLNGHQQQDSDEYLAPEPRHTRTRSDSSGSMWSTISGSPSLAQTVFTFFDDVDVDTDDDGCQGVHLARRSNAEGDSPAHDRPSTWMKVRRYFRPLRKKVYYMSLLHLLLINFPVALLAWVSLFVFTLVCALLSSICPVSCVSAVAGHDTPHSSPHRPLIMLHRFD